MEFTPDTQDTLRAAVLLVNTAGDPDALSSLADLGQLLGVLLYTGRMDGDAAELAALRKLRPRLRAMLLAGRDEMAGQVNDVLQRTPLNAHLTRHDDLDWHLHAVASDRPLAERVLIETAMALIDVIRADEGSRITVCTDEACDKLALDLSRNRSKRYCSTTCANRNAVAAYRIRQATKPPIPPP